MSEAEQNILIAATVGSMQHHNQQQARRRAGVHNGQHTGPQAQKGRMHVTHDLTVVHVIMSPSLCGPLHNYEASVMHAYAARLFEGHTHPCWHVRWCHFNQQQCNSHPQLSGTT